ncbi:hypothetical protein RA267_29095, partial [Pseudomonas syringae pv. tagetis]
PISPVIFLTLIRGAFLPPLPGSSPFTLHNRFNPAGPADQIPPFAAQVVILNVNVQNAFSCTVT